MAAVPLIGRLFWREYFALLGSLILIFLEVLIRIVTLALPQRVINFLYNQSRSVFNSLSSPASRRARDSRRSVIDPIAKAADFVELCNLFGYYAEEHVVQTGDGYLLGLHRLAWPKGEEDVRVNAGHGSQRKKVVYLHHGLMMNSEVWLALSEAERCLPIQLVKAGYDVWLGNNRGNKYSRKSVRHSPDQTAFWDFSLDDFAFHDIPDAISYVLETTSQPSLSYIGFSQGTAQAFAALSIHPYLNERVDVFVALAPAMSPPGLANGIVASLVKASPRLLYLAFGRRSILSSTAMWQSLMYPPIFVRIIDHGLDFLFGWQTRNITQNQKLAAYPHLYSFASVKCVVHWFQIINSGIFQTFDDEVQSPFDFSMGRRYYKVARFPTRNIKTPVTLVWGGSDSLVDINVMLRELPRHTEAKEIPKYEHLDMLWAEDVDKLVFPHVFDALNRYSKGNEDDGRGEAGEPGSRSHAQAALPSKPHYQQNGKGSNGPFQDGFSKGLSNRKGKHGGGFDAGDVASDPHSLLVRWTSASSITSSASTLVDTKANEDTENMPTGDIPGQRLRKQGSKSSISSINSTGIDTRIGRKGIDLGASLAAPNVLSVETQAQRRSWHDAAKTKLRSKSTGVSTSHTGPRRAVGQILEVNAV